MSIAPTDPLSTADGSELPLFDLIFDDEEQLALLERAPHEAPSTVPADHAAWTESPDGTETGGMHLNCESTGAIAHTRTPVKKNRSRERRKLEMQVLREHASLLEKTLRDVRLQQVRKREADRWRDVGAAELTKRRRCEDLNSELRARLNEQLEVARSFQRTLLEHTIGTVEAVRSRGAISSEHVFTRMEREASTAYAMVDSVLQDANMVDAKVAFNSAQALVKTRVTDGREEQFVELVDSKLVPFDLARSCDALWLALQTDALSQGHHAPVQESTVDTIQISSKYPLSLHGQVEMLDSLVVMKRFREASRMVVVWRATTSILRPTAGSDETGWMIVRELDDHAERDGHHPEERSCVFQTISHHAPLRHTTMMAGLAANDLERDALQTVLLNSTEHDLASVTTAMQNLLLADALDSVAEA